MNMSSLRWDRKQQQRQYWKQKKRKEKMMSAKNMDRRLKNGDWYWITQ